MVALCAICAIGQSMSSASVWLACVLHGYCRISRLFSDLQVDILSGNGDIVCHLCHWSVNVTCGGQCHMHLFGWPVCCTFIAEYLVI